MRHVGRSASVLAKQQIFVAPVSCILSALTVAVGCPRHSKLGWCSLWIEQLPLVFIIGARIPMKTESTSQQSMRGKVVESRLINTVGWAGLMRALGPGIVFGYILGAVAYITCFVIAF